VKTKRFKSQNIVEPMVSFSKKKKRGQKRSQKEVSNSFNSGFFNFLCLTSKYNFGEKDHLKALNIDFGSSIARYVGGRVLRNVVYNLAKVKCFCV
jgi:hypothetical protein